MMGAVSLPRRVESLIPLGAIAPAVKTLYYPLDSASALATGGTIPSGFARRIKITGTTRDDPLTIAVTAGSISLAAGGGLVPSNGANVNASFDPGAGAALDFLRSMLNLATFNPGQTLMVGVELEAPAGWNAAFVATACLVSVGGFGSADAGGGFGFALASNRRPSFVWRGAGASAVGATIVNLVGVDASLGSLAEASRNVVVYELQCTAAHQFRIRAHLAKPGISATGAWSASVDLRDPGNGGTEAPGPVAGAGLRILGRKENTANQLRMQRLEVVRNLFLALFDEPPRDSVGPKICSDMLLRKGCRPRSLTLYDANDVDIETSPDGSYDRAIFPVTLGDIFVAFDGKRAITDHPQFTVIQETGTTKGSNKSTNIDVLNPNWTSNADFEGTVRQAPVPGGLKFARTTLAPGSIDYPAFLFSSYPTDQSNRSRSELGWRSPATTIPYDTVIWIAAKIWYDFDIGPGQEHVTIAQVYHGGVNSGLNPFFSLSLYSNRLSVSVRWSDKVGMVKADQVNTNFSMFDAPAQVRGRWFDFVVKANFNWDPAAPRPAFVQAWIDNDQVINFTGPIGYRGPAGPDLIPLAPEMRFGNYPGVVTTWTPDLVRDVYFRKGFVARNVGNYTLDQIRAALAS